MTPSRVRLVSPPALFGMLGLMVLGAAAAGICRGAADIPVSDVFSSLVGGRMSDSGSALTILQLRLPRVVLALIVGAALGMSGAAMQGLFRNPLVEPGLIGVSSGAALAAVALIVLGGAIAQHLPDRVATIVQGFWLLPLVSFGGGAVTALLVTLIARTDGQTPVAVILLAGLAVNAITGGLIGILAYIATDNALREATFWMFGSLARADWSEIALTAPPLILAIAMLPRSARALNALQLGEAAAGHLGIDVERLKRRTLLWVLVAVGCSVALCGAIGFVGLIAPHAVRLAAGPDNRIVLPGSAMAGAGLLALSDLAARTAAPPADIPIGIITTLLGGPFFIFLLLQLRRTAAFQ